MGNKIKILIIVYSVDVTNRPAVNYCKGIDKSVFDVKVLAYGNIGGKEHDFDDIGIEYVVANWDLQIIASTIKKWQIDAINFFGDGVFVPMEYEFFKKAREINPNVVLLETNFFGKYEPKSFSLLDCSLQVSKMMMNERYVKKVGHFDYEKMKIIYHAIDCKGWDALDISEEEVRQNRKTLGIKEKDFVIGKLGRPAIEKWSDLLLYMMPYLVKLVPNIKFIVQEMPDSRKRRVLRSKFKNYFILLKKTMNDREVALFYRTIDVYVHASKIGESFGMTLAEAGAFGKPVIINSTPHRDNNQLEMIEHMKTGIIANHPQTFARAVEFLYKNNHIRLNMGMEARKKVVALFDPRKIAEQLEKVIVEKMIQKKLVVDQVLVDRYAKLSYFPSKKEIMEYVSEYQRRLKLDFGNLSAKEKIVNYFNLPRKFYYKVRDFVEHKFGV